MPPEDEVYLSVVTAVYNEADNLPTLLAEIAAALRDCFFPWEVVVVNDGSTDDSPAVLRQLLGEYPQLRVLSLRQRSGQTAALDAGLRRARGRYIATLDADLQNDPADIPALLAVVEAGRCDLANGWRKERCDPWLRRISTRIANAVRNYLTRECIHDSACGLKVFRRECIADIKLFTGLHRFLPTLVKLEGYRVEEFPVHHRPRTAGKAKYGVWNRLFRALRDTFAVRWMQARMFHYTCDEWEH